MTAKPGYREIQCRSALNKVEGMDFAWSLNPYRGCVHGCHYCYARRYHTYFDLNVDDDFSSVIFVKLNVARVLREELSMRSWRREEVALGTATDPYQPIEGSYRLTRACLEAFADWRNPVGIVSKGPLVIRDIDVLQQVSAVADCSVYMSITTLDDDLARRLEPTTASPRQRLRAVEALARSGIKVGVLIAPIVPGLTDAPRDLDALVHSAREHGASLVGGRVLELKPGTREHFLDYLAGEAPELMYTYRRIYPCHSAQAGRAAVVQRSLAEACERHGVPMRSRTRQTPSRQIALPI